MKYVKISQVPGLDPEDTIMSMAKACPKGSAVEIPTKDFPSGRGRGALMGGIKRHTGRSFEIHQQNGTTFLIPKHGNSKLLKKVLNKVLKTSAKSNTKTTHKKSSEKTGQDGRRLASSKPPHNQYPVLRKLKGNYGKKIIAAIDLHGGVMILKSAFGSNQAKGSCVFSLRQQGYLVAGTSRSSNSMVITRAPGTPRPKVSIGQKVTTPSTPPVLPPAPETAVPPVVRPGSDDASLTS